MSDRQVKDQHIPAGAINLIRYYQEAVLSPAPSNVVVDHMINMLATFVERYEIAASAASPALRKAVEVLVTSARLDRASAVEATRNAAIRAERSARQAAEARAEVAKDKELDLVVALDEAQMRVLTLEQRVAELERALNKRRTTADTCRCERCRATIAQAMADGWACDVCNYRGAPVALDCACYEGQCGGGVSAGSGCSHGAIICPACDDGDGVSGWEVVRELRKVLQGEAERVAEGGEGVA